MKDLIERIEADGPSRKLDVEIFRAAYRMEYRYEHLDDPGPEFTSSIDAAMMLVPDDRRVALIQQPSGAWSCAMLTLGDDYRDQCEVEDAPTPALALCAAALRARQEV